MRNSRQRRESLVYHAKPQPGKIKIVPTKPYQTQRDLAIAYSPGVAEPCLEIAETPTDVYKVLDSFVDPIPKCDPNL